MGQRCSAAYWVHLAESTSQKSTTRRASPVGLPGGQVLVGLEGVEPPYQIDVPREGSLDVMAVLVEVSEDIFSDEIKVLEKLSKKIQAEIKDMLGVTCKVKLVEPRSIQRSEGKAQRVIDRRKM